MTNRSGLTGETTAAYIHQNIELVCRLGRNQRLTDNELQCLKAKILIDISFIDRNLTCTRY